MQVALLVNPASGKGAGRPLGEQLEAALTTAGHGVSRVGLGVGPDAFISRLRDAAARSDVLVVVGGDGTVHHALPGLLGGRAALYHCGVGTENLFCREFGMVPEPARVVAAVGRGLVREIDLAEITLPGGTPRPFAVMAGMGPDAGVISRLHLARRGPITHASYLWPVVQELWSPCLPTIRVEVDGREVVAGVRGWLIVANMRQFALRLDPAWKADPADGRLDVVFMPGSDGLAAAGWMFSASGGRHVKSPNLVYAQGASVRVVNELGGASLQCDGESIGDAWGWRELEIRLVGPRLRVLMP
jgi:diacylglycerol kinase (ATP)